jgi:Na+/H+ antiporter NhaD/arsenite permease-like protein
MNAPPWVSLAIVAVTYALVSMRRVPLLNLDRPMVALGGAVAMVALGVLPLSEAYGAVNLDTLALLLGMMVMVSYLRQAGFFELVAALVVERARSPRQLLVLVVFVAGLLSAAFVIDTICLLFTPILLAAVRAAALPPVPFLLALCTSANVGSVATLTGNPQNMLVGIYSGISYGRFLLIELPAALVCLGLVALLLTWIHRRELPAEFPRREKPERRVDLVVVRRELAVLGLVLLGFLLPLARWIPGLKPGQQLPLVALSGALLAALVGRYPPALALRHVDLGLLLFFSGLFVVVRGVAQAGLLERLHAHLSPLFEGSAARQTAALSALNLVASNLVSNVPFVVLAREWMLAFRDPALHWHVLATVSTFAGNLTIVGSVANIIVLEESRHVAPIGFLAYLRAGLPITLVTTAVAVSLLLALNTWTPLL